jgi:hypothetical protein
MLQKGNMYFEGTSYGLKTLLEKRTNLMFTYLQVGRHICLPVGVRSHYLRVGDKLTLTNRLNKNTTLSRRKLNTPIKLGNGVRKRKKSQQHLPRFYGRIWLKTPIKLCNGVRKKEKEKKPNNTFQGSMVEFDWKLGSIENLKMSKINQISNASW